MTATKGKTTIEDVWKVIKSLGEEHKKTEKDGKGLAGGSGGT